MANPFGVAGSLEASRVTCGVGWLGLHTMQRSSRAFSPTGQCVSAALRAASEANTGTQAPPNAGLRTRITPCAGTDNL